MSDDVIRTVNRGGYNKTAVLALLDELNFVLLSAEDGGLSVTEKSMAVDSILRKAEELPVVRFGGGFDKDDVNNYIRNAIDKIYNK